MGLLISTGACPFCGNGNNTPCFAQYSDGYKCFSCGVNKKQDGSTYAFRPSLVMFDRKLDIPEHTQNIREFSPTVLQWLYKYYVYDDLIKKYGISYAKYDKFGQFEGESLLFPQFQDNKLIFYTRRFFPEKKFILRGDKTSPFIIKCDAKSDKIVLVEDFISAIRLAEHVNVLCLWGVHISFMCRKYLETSTYNVEIWLDPDEAGQSASKVILNQLSKSMQYYTKNRAFAISEPRTVSIRSTELQPKDYSDFELKRLLGEKNNEVI